MFDEGTRYHHISKFSNFFKFRPRKLDLPWRLVFEGREKELELINMDNLNSSDSSYSDTGTITTDKACTNNPAAGTLGTRRSREGMIYIYAKGKR